MMAITELLIILGHDAQDLEVGLAHAAACHTADVGDGVVNTALYDTVAAVELLLVLSEHVEAEKSGLYRDADLSSVNNYYFEHNNTSDTLAGTTNTEGA